MWQLFMLQAPGGNDIMTFVSNYGLLMVFILVVWLFFLRPQAKKQKAQSKFMDNIQKGDEVVTSSGLIGRINKIEGSIVTMEIGNKTFVRVLKNSLSKEMTEGIQKESNDG